MDEFETNELVVRKKKYAYIILIIVFVASVVGSSTYFSSLKKNGEAGISREISGDKSGEDIVVISGEEIGEVSGEVVSPDIPKPIENETSKDNEIENNGNVSGDGISSVTGINYFEGNRKLDPNKPMVALTFDDGPDPKRTLKMIEILKKYGVVATFFDIGTNMEKYPDVVKAEIEAGCDVGGHTYSHVNLNPLSEKEIKEEITKVEDAFRNATGKELKYIRPTYGNANSKVRAVTDRPIINWCVDSLDWKSRNADKVIEEIKKTKNFDGRIILMHVIYDSTLEAVDRLIPDLIKDGYQIVTVSELAEYKGFTLEEGKIYYQFIK